MNYLITWRQESLTLIQMTETKLKRQFQTYFVKEVFLNSVFKSNHLYYAEDNNADYGLVNQLMIDQFAEQIVDMDVIDLSHITIDE